MKRTPLALRSAFTSVQVEACPMGMSFTYTDLTRMTNPAPAVPQDRLGWRSTRRRRKRRPKGAARTVEFRPVLRAPAAPAEPAEPEERRPEKHERGRLRDGSLREGI